MKILITGITGLVGRELGKRLVQQGHEIVGLSRGGQEFQDQLPFPITLIRWDPLHEDIPHQAFANVEAVVHLAGEPIAAKRWSEDQREKIESSRVVSTRKIVAAIRERKAQIKTAAFASAIGFYGDRGDATLDENSSSGSGFLADVCRRWEDEVLRQPLDGVRIAIIRIGLVLSREGGMMAKMLPIFSSGLGGRLGDGRQWMSWIHIEDLARIFLEALQNEKLSGILNGVSPQPVTNQEFTKNLGEVLHRPTLFTAPGFGLKMILGDMSQLMLASMKVLPKKLESFGFSFHYPEISGALKEVCGVSAADGDQVLVSEQWFPLPIEQVFEFFSDARNLEKITPPWLNFQVQGMSTETIQKDTTIDYQLKVHEIPIRWRSKISEWEPNKRFVDEQLRGPYAKWHHTHTFESVQGGTLVGDRVVYRVPMGFLGQTVAGVFVRKDLEKIFEYRRKRIPELLFKSLP